MTTFRITAMLTISVSTVVEADTPQDALGIAQGRSIQQLPIDSADDTQEWCHGGELDGMPYDLKVEVAK